MSIDIVEKDFGVLQVKEMFTRGLPVCNLELHPAEEGEPPYYAINWMTQVEMREGLEIIRRSYLESKRQFKEPRALIPVERAYPLGKYVHQVTGIVYFSGPVQLLLRGHRNLMAVGIDTFMNPTSFSTDNGGSTFLEWIRVNGEYFQYYLEAGESPGEKKIAGGVGQEFIGDILTDFYAETAVTKLDTSEARSLKDILTRSLDHLPKLETR